MPNKRGVFQGFKKTHRGTFFLMLHREIFTKLPNVFDGEIVNPLMHNVPNGQTQFKNIEANAARFLKCV